jgi:hypothetical protein
MSNGGHARIQNENVIPYLYHLISIYFASGYKSLAMADME